MRIFSSLLASLTLAFGASAQSSVWKISHDGHTLYLGGTCHVLRAQDFPLPAEFQTAFNASDAVYFETDIERVSSPEMQQVVMREGFFHDGRSLKDVLSPEAWQAVQDYCAQSGLPLGDAQRMKPWFFTIMVAVVEMQKLGLTQQGVDVYYFQHARAADKPTHGLESFEQQVQFITNLGAGYESEMIAKTLADVQQLPSMMDNIVSAWRNGDLDRIEESILTEMRRDFPTVFKELLADRNDAWMIKIEELIATPPTEYILVGVGHMAGEEGLIAQLSRRGYSVEQLVAAPVAAAAE
jgi:uncharacterized protein